MVPNFKKLSLTYWLWPRVFRRTSGSIVLKFTALTYFESNQRLIIKFLWFDHSLRKTYVIGETQKLFRIISESHHSDVRPMKWKIKKIFDIVQPYIMINISFESAQRAQQVEHIQFENLEIVQFRKIKFYFTIHI